MKTFIFLFCITGCTANFSVSKDGTHNFSWTSNKEKIQLDDDPLKGDDLHDTKQSDSFDIVRGR